MCPDCQCDHTFACDSFTNLEGLAFLASSFQGTHCLACSPCSNQSLRVHWHFTAPWSVSCSILISLTTLNRHQSRISLDSRVTWQDSGGAPSACRLTFRSSSNSTTEVYWPYPANSFDYLSNYERSFGVARRSASFI